VEKKVIEIDYCPRPLQDKMHDGLENFRFSVVVAHRRFGKTVAAINHLIRQASQADKFNPRYGYVAPYRTQAEQIAWAYLCHYTRPIPGTQENVSQLSITLPNKAQIRLFGADNPHSFRGLYFDGLILDEPAQMRDNLWDEVILPTLADRKGWAVFIGTPAGINRFYEIAMNAQRRSDWFFAEFPALKRNGTVATDALDAEDIQLQKDLMPESKFRQEYLCDFTAASENTLIPIDLVDKAMARSLPLSTYFASPVVLGVDPARFGDDRFVVVIRQGLCVRHIQQMNDVDTMTGAGIVSSLIESWHPAATLVDSIGVGAGVADRLRQLGYRVIDVNSGNKAGKSTKYFNKRAEMWDLMRLWLLDGAALPDNSELRSDLVAPQFEYDPRNRLKLEKKESMKERGLPSPDLGDALAMTFALPVSTKRTPQLLERISKRRKRGTFSRLEEHMARDVA
jgi:hypothetical protein